ncbi:LysR family transcriptional regulator [Rubellimicrobium roseum]|uniref:LysR family transcriptional regulator n=1 Tax=Rubellimicrobium roseum TaxID=687525 RepID=A0A5C4N645_9RHOB|nr:LysR family transcriptional regulator [Rubellimicrobium roseum]TNC59852.1 LysR family transcriptional regulator [Rubellimicrobium roseum]
MRRLDNIDIRLLRVFLALAEAGGFAEAQVALNLSQSTLSTHLAELEKRLGGQLCHRGRQQFRLTELGQATREAALKLLRDLDEFNQRIAAVRGGLSGRLRIGTSDGTMTHDRLGIQAAISRFLTPDTDVLVDLILGAPAELERAVADGERDIVIGPLTRKAPGVVFLDFVGEPHLLYCGNGHPLFALPDSEITKRHVDEARFSVRSYRHFDDLYRVGHPKASASVVHMEAQLMLILSGRFIGFLPCHFADFYITTGQLRPIKPDIFHFTSMHNVAFREQDRDNVLISGFRKVLLEVRNSRAL